MHHVQRRIHTKKNKQNFLFARADDCRFNTISCTAALKETHQNNFGVRRIKIAKGHLMAVFIDIIRLGNSPAEQEVPKASPNTHGDKQPCIESHCDQHEEITESNLNDMQE